MSMKRTCAISRRCLVFCSSAIQWKLRQVAQSPLHDFSRARETRALPRQKRFGDSRRRLILFYGRNSGEYRLVIGDCVICLGAKIEFSRACAFSLVLSLTGAALAQ